jgi:hypothetical protein
MTPGALRCICDRILRQLEPTSTIAAMQQLMKPTDSRSHNLDFLPLVAGFAEPQGYSCNRRSTLVQYVDRPAKGVNAQIDHLGQQVAGADLSLVDRFVMIRKLEAEVVNLEVAVRPHMKKVVPHASSPFGWRRAVDAECSRLWLTFVKILTS